MNINEAYKLTCDARAGKEARLKKHVDEQLSYVFQRISEEANSGRFNVTLFLDCSTTVGNLVVKRLQDNGFEVDSLISENFELVINWELQEL